MEEVTKGTEISQRSVRCTLAFIFVQRSVLELAIGKLTLLSLVIGISHHTASTCSERCKFCFSERSKWAVQHMPAMQILIEVQGYWVWVYLSME
jgi:hypothetical protein